MSNTPLIYENTNEGTDTIVGDLTSYTIGNNVEQYWIESKGKKQFHYKNQEYENIEQKFRKQIHGRLKAASLLRNKEIELEQTGAWTIIGEEGSYHVTHTHFHGRNEGISTVIYLNVPESKTDDQSNSIFLVFHTDPPSHFINTPCPNIHHIKPEVGKLLIFPYHIPHGTYPQTKGIRQTFNIDYYFSANSNEIYKNNIIKYQ